MKFIQLFSLIGVAVGLAACTSGTTEKEAAAHADTLLFEVRTPTQSYGHCNPDSGTCTYIRYEFPVLNGPATPLADTIRVVTARMLSLPTFSETAVDSAQKAFLKEYDRHIHEEKGDSSVPWNVNAGLSVIRQTRHWICLEESNGGYTGGAHDFGYNQYHLLDKSTGRHLHLADFFDSTGLKKLTRLGEIEFCIVRGIKDNQSFEEAGFTFENGKFFLPENFCFQPEGIHFLFNSYEVAPYYLGPTEFTIPANKIVTLMKKQP